MPDFAGDALRAVASHGSRAPGLLFAAGAVSSVGPCTAPRLIAISGIVAKAQRRDAFAVAAVFSAGLIFGYASFGAAAAVLAHALRSSSFVYGILALVLCIGGAATIWRSDACKHSAPQAPKNLAGVFMLGASFALVVSPCCTPLVTAILAYAGASANPASPCWLLACFAAGHTCVLFAAAAGTAQINELLRRRSVQESARLAGGTLMLALAGYYGLLA